MNPALYTFPELPKTPPSFTARFWSIYHRSHMSFSSNGDFRRSVVFGSWLGQFYAAHASPRFCQWWNH